MRGQRNTHIMSINNRQWLKQVILITFPVEGEKAGERFTMRRRTRTGLKYQMQMIKSLSYLQ